MTSVLEPDDDTIPDDYVPPRRDKSELRAETSQHVAEYLARGGKVTTVEAGKHTIDYAQSRAWKDTAKANFIINAERGGTHGLHEK